MNNGNNEGAMARYLVTIGHQNKIKNNQIYSLFPIDPLLIIFQSMRIVGNIIDRIIFVKITSSICHGSGIQNASARPINTLRSVTIIDRSPLLIAIDRVEWQIGHTSRNIIA